MCQNFHESTCFMENCPSVNINLLARPDCLFQQLLSFFFLPRIATNLNRMSGHLKLFLENMFAEDVCCPWTCPKDFGLCPLFLLGLGSLFFWRLLLHPLLTFSPPPHFLLHETLLTTLIFLFFFSSYFSKWLANVRQMFSNVSKIRGRHVALETV